MPRLRAACLSISLLTACGSAIRADEQEAEKPVVIAAATGADGSRIAPAPAPTVAPPRPATTLPASGQLGPVTPKL